MAFIQPSIEGPPSSIQDPWDWTVDQVVSALTDRDSPLLKTNSPLHLPDATFLAKIIRDNDITGLALLRDVTTPCLRDELGIKSFGHRSSINLLIEQLQEVSPKFQEKTQRSARLSSVGYGSRIGTPPFPTPSSLEPQAAFRSLASTSSPISLSTQLQDHFGLGKPSAQLQNPLQRGSETQGLGQPNSITCHSLGDLPPEGGLGITIGEGKSDMLKPEKTVTNAGAIALSHEKCWSSNARNLSDAERSERLYHQGETIVIDEAGNKRRRLVNAPGTLGAAQTMAAKSPTFGDPPSSPETLQKDTNANPSFESNIFPTSGYPIFDEEQPLNTQESSAPVQAATLMLDSVLDSADAVAEPGAMMIDKDGRKRMKPILVHAADLEFKDQQVKPTPETANDTFGSHKPILQEVKHAKHLQQRSYGKKAKRRADQIYLGFDSMPVDTLIYGNAAFGKDLDQPQMLPTSSQVDQPNESDDFNIVPNSDVGTGQRLYVHNRMKYLLRAQRISLKRDGYTHIGILPYPDVISRKNQPLSMTIFSPSSHGIIASRANRSKWTRNKVVPNAIEADGRTGNLFNVADPALARDESEDPEWRSLEKWNFMDDEDKVLPLYGESDSEGEYDLETWREMEKEQGKITRPLGRSRSAKLTSAEVQDAIGVAMDQIVRDWTLKRLPKLKLKGWRLWTKSRRDRNSQSQISSFTCDLEKLAARIVGLRKEIAHEEWSKISQINKQCKIIQPSIFDREDCKWKIATLKLQKAPERPPPSIKQPKLAKSLAPKAVPADDEESLTASTGTSESSGDDLDGFIVEDDVDGDSCQPAIVDDDLTMADVEDDIDSVTYVVDEPKPETPIMSARKFSQPEPSPSNVIDLTQQSDPVEPDDFAPKPERSYIIQTPPLYGSENDSEIFQRSRSRKPVFKMPPTVPKSPTKTMEIISLESDSNDSVGFANPGPPNHFPALKDIEGIRAMNADDLVERQDRKRLLIWMVSHTPQSGRRAAFQYLNKVSVEVSRANVTSGLQELCHHGRSLKDGDNKDLDSIMRIGAWRVCWTIPVKVTSEGLQIPHIITTLEDEDGYEPFYDFLLECLQHYQKAPSHPSPEKPKKRRQLIAREDSDDEGLLDSQTRKRKYLVAESQETLKKRHDAQDRLRANEERRREELKHRFTTMGTDSIDNLEVVVNPGKLADQDFIYLNPRFGNGARIKAHQQEGLQFLWREITSEHEDLQGCLLAQTMGLGKTMQVIALLVTLAETARSTNKNIRDQIPRGLRKCRTLILCPPALLENWWDECLLWPPLPLSDNIGELRKVDSGMNQADRLIQIHAWSEEGGTLLLGYHTFKDLIHNKPRTGARAKEKKAPLDDEQHEMVKKALLRRPTLVIADEAHQFKRKISSLNLAMNQIKTKSRIALTGSPLNNNLGEYHSLIDWIAPGYLGNYIEFKATYEEPISEGLYQDSTESQYRESRKRLKALELEMEPKVHRANASCLHAELKGKSEYVITVPLTELQRKLYGIYAENMLVASSDKEPGVATLWSWLTNLKLLCNHPKCYNGKLLEVENRPASTKVVPQKKKVSISVAEEALIGSDDDIEISDEPVSRFGLSKTRDESRKVLESLTEPLDALFLSHKMQVLMNILSFSQDAQDKVLVFSHSIPTLDYVGEQLLKTHKGFVRIDGKVDPQKRQSMTKVFNEGKTNVCIVSTQAGGQGLNLFGANRVVILDEHWNPMWEQQAIGRAYRIGQQKPVYVYRLTVGGTFEQAIQNQALFKEQLATRVVDKKNPNRSALKGAGDYLFPPKTVHQEDLSEFLGKDPLVLDRLLADEAE